MVVDLYSKLHIMGYATSIKEKKMSCGCGGGCSDKIAALETLVKVLEGRIFSIEAQLNAKEWPRDPFVNYPVWNTPRVKMGCPVCGIGADGKPMGYACSNPNCPTKVTCTNTGAVWAS
jgi:hypothetical protein